MNESKAPKAVASVATAASTRAEVVIDEGLRDYMLRIYVKVALGLVLSAGLAYLTSSVPGIRDLLFKTATDDGAVSLAGITSVGWVVALAPLMIIMSYEPTLKKPARFKSATLYWSIVACMGASQGLLVLAFTGASVATTLLVTATAFGGLSLFGYATRKDLTALGSFLAVGLLGLLLGLGVNLLLHSPAVAFVTSAAGVLIFAGLIAYDTQRLKLAYYQLGEDADLGAASDVGALSLYVDFINLFQFLLLALSGERR